MFAVEHKGSQPEVFHTHNIRRKISVHGTLLNLFTISALGRYDVLPFTDEVRKCIVKFAERCGCQSSPKEVLLQQFETITMILNQLKCRE